MARTNRSSLTHTIRKQTGPAMRRPVNVKTVGIVLTILPSALEANEACSFRCVGTAMSDQGRSRADKRENA